MTGPPRSLDNPINWSFPVGKMFGVTIRLHLFFVIGALWMIFGAVAAPEGGPAPPLGRALLNGLGAAAMLFLIVLAHEFGHCFGARRMGGSADEILLWPLGGLAFVNAPHNPVAQLVTVVAGPMVNVVLCAVSSVALIVWGGSIGAVPWNPLHPFSPAGPWIVYTEGQTWLAMFYGLAYTNLLFNLLPVFPMDGGRMLQCALWPRRGYREATAVACGVGMVGAILFGLAGLLMKEYLILGVAFFGYLTCYQQRQMIKAGFEAEGEFGYGYSQGYGSSGARKPSKPSWWARRRAAKALAREQRDRRQLAELEKQVDAILDKVRDQGLASLSDRERRTLAEATERRKIEDHKPRHPG